MIFAVMYTTQEFSSRIEKKLKKIMPSLGKSNMTSVYTVRHDESFFSDFLSFLNPNLSHRRNKYRSGQLIKEIKLNHKQ